MLNILKRPKQKPRLYLGNLAVAPETGFTKAAANIQSYRSIDTDQLLHSMAVEHFSLVSLAERTEVKDSDLAIDILITKYRSGYYRPLTN